MELKASEKVQNYEIKELVKKNGHEQHQIDELKDKVASQQEKIIELQARIINCEKNGSKAQNSPPPPPPMPNPTKKEWEKPQPEPTKPPQQVKKTHNQALKEALEKRRKIMAGEE